LGEVRTYRIFLDPRKIKEDVPFRVEPSALKVTGVKSYIPNAGFFRLPMNSMVIMGHDWTVAAHPPLDLELVKKWSKFCRKYGKIVFGEVWAESQSDRVAQAENLAKADVDAITIQEQYANYTITVEEINEIASAAKEVKPDVLVGIFEAEIAQLDALLAGKPEVDYIGLELWEDFEASKAKINTLRIRARENGMLCFGDVQFADSAKTAYDPVTFMDITMLAYNMLDGVWCWGYGAAGMPWRDRWHQVLETYQMIKHGQFQVPLFRGLSLDAGAIAYGLHLFIPARIFYVHLIDSEAATAECLISFDWGATQYSWRTWDLVAGTYNGQEFTWRQPYVTVVNVTQGATAGVLNGWITYSYPY